MSSRPLLCELRHSAETEIVGPSLCFQDWQEVCKTFIRRFDSDPRLQPD